MLETSALSNNYISNLSQETLMLPKISSDKFYVFSSFLVFNNQGIHVHTSLSGFQIFRQLFTTARGPIDQGTMSGPFAFDIILHEFKIINFNFIKL